MGSKEQKEQAWFNNLKVSTARIHSQSEYRDAFFPDIPRISMKISS